MAFIARRMAFMGAGAAAAFFIAFAMIRRGVVERSEKAGKILSRAKEKPSPPTPPHTPPYNPAPSFPSPSFFLQTRQVHSTLIQVRGIPALRLTEAHRAADAQHV